MVAAVLLHALVLLLPLTSTVPPSSGDEGIELELVAYLPHPPTVQETSPEPPLQTPKITPPSVAEPVPPALPPTPAEVASQQSVVLLKRKPADNTDIILSRQFITEESAAEQLFGKPLIFDQAAMQREFHFPARPNMLTMLYAPMQDLPFEYTPGLVHFAYAPGVKGDLQRFWDIITPEFGWRTNNGTEFRCVWLLVVVGCGWK